MFFSSQKQKLDIAHRSMINIHKVWLHLDWHEFLIELAALVENNTVRVCDAEWGANSL